MKFLSSHIYQKTCIAKYEHYEARISFLIPESKIEHIGASAIDGALSKGDLDIYVEVKKESIDSAIYLLSQLDFETKEDTHRSSELCMLELPGEDVAVQLVAAGSQYTHFIVFRDLLISNKVLLQSYNDMKKSCIGFSVEEYRSRKGQFIECVLSRHNKEQQGTY